MANGTTNIPIPTKMLVPFPIEMKRSEMERSEMKRVVQMLHRCLAIGLSKGQCP